MNALPARLSRTRTLRLGGRAGISLLLGVLLAVFGQSASAWAGTVGVDPAGCGTGSTWTYTDYNVAGAIIREEVRHSYGCGDVGWGRISHVGGSYPALALVQSAWTTGGPSETGVSGTNWTYTADASPGHQVCAGFQAYSVDEFGNWHYIGWFNENPQTKVPNCYSV